MKLCKDNFGDEIFNYKASKSTFF